MSEKEAGLFDWLKPPIQPGSPEAAKMAALNAARKEITRRFAPQIVQWARRINSQLDSLSKKYGVDPKYVKLILIRPTRFWPAMSQKNRLILLTAKDILLGAGLVPSVAGVQLPATMEGEEAVDMVFIEMANWMRVKVGKKLEDEYYKIVMSVAKPLIRQLRDPDDPDPPLVDVATQISGYFRQALRTGRETSPQRGLMLRVIEDLID